MRFSKKYIYYEAIGLDLLAQELVFLLRVLLR